MTAPSATQERAEQPTDKTAIRPFGVNVAEADLTDLRRPVLDRGGHFAASEKPALFASELRAAFRPLRERDQCEVQI